MKKPHLIFRTEENGERIKALSEKVPHVSCKDCGHTVIAEVLEPHDCPGPILEEEMTNNA